MSLLWGWNQQNNHSSKNPCNPVSLHQGGTLVFNETHKVTLTQNAVYEPPCTITPRPAPQDPSTVLDFHEPFYASTSPQMYAVAVATVLAYVLAIILFITPRTFFIGGRGGGFLGRHGMISGSYGSASVVGVGGRPWLQKVAALSVTVSLSIVTGDSFRVAKNQYELGYMDSTALTHEVVNSLEIRVIRVISSTFLWLAQVQTLIRLFPRHKEKVIIKWVGFALIVLDTIFSILNSFVSPRSNLVRPGSIIHAIPALNYLFELSLSLLYAAWVIFYSISKHRVAFFHVKMRNICLVALLSLIAVLIPVVFFILDVSQPDVAGWGEFIRWVGAAAASVVVWEWVERIEALEREERKDGILGREVFDGDEMLEQATPSEDGWPGRPGGRRHDKGHGSGGKSGWGSMIGLSGIPWLSHRKFNDRLPQFHRWKRRNSETSPKTHEASPHIDPTPPPTAVTPISRGDTTSAASTIYRVRYHSVSSPTPSSLDLSPREGNVKEPQPSLGKEANDLEGYNIPKSIPTHRQGIGWLSLANPFKRQRRSPPQEVATAQADEGNALNTVVTEPICDAQQRLKLRPRFSTALSLLHRGDNPPKSNHNSDPPILPVTVIPVRAKREGTSAQDSTEPTTNSQLRRNDANERKMTETPLPVMVIPARPRSSKTWPTPGLDESRTSAAGNRTEASSTDPSSSRYTPDSVGLNHSHMSNNQRTLDNPSPHTDPETTHHGVEEEEHGEYRSTAQEESHFPSPSHDISGDERAAAIRTQETNIVDTPTLDSPGISPIGSHDGGRSSIERAGGRSTAVEVPIPESTRPSETPPFDGEDR